MSSFPRELSKTIDHGRAGFLIHSIAPESRALLHPEAIWLLDYAYRNVDREGVPLRCDINPSGMKHLLPKIMIMQPELSPKGELRDVTVRLMGSDVSAFYGDISGSSLRMLANEIATERGFMCIERALADRTPVVGVSKRTDFETPYYQVTMLFIPVLESNSSQPQILAYFHANQLDH